MSVININCLHGMLMLPDNSVDAIVTDPPYGLSAQSSADIAECLRNWTAGDVYEHGKSGFMGRKWDSFVPGPEIWREALRVLKPGGHIVAFAGTRTQHLMALSLQLAGFEIRDMLAWIYGSGFPKSHDVSKAIDASAGAEREVIGRDKNFGASKASDGKQAFGDYAGAWDITAPATDAARQWQGWGTALKPALEPITLARKPLIGTVCANVLTHGTGAINIDGCRVPGEDTTTRHSHSSSYMTGKIGEVQVKQEPYTTGSDKGRFPANLLHDGSDDVVALFPDSKGSGGSVPNVKITGYGVGIGDGESTYFGGERTQVDSGSGSAARFFYCSKASKRDREEGLTGLTQRADTSDGALRDGGRESAARANTHPTVKPTDLMRYLCRLITPPGGLVLDPFSGSGSTGKAAILEGFKFIGFELDSDYTNIANARIDAARLERNK